MYDESREYDKKWQRVCDTRAEKAEIETTVRMVETMLQKGWASTEEIAGAYGMSIAEVEKIRKDMAMATAMA